MSVLVGSAYVRSSDCFFFFSSRRRHTRYWRDWSSDVCSSDLADTLAEWLQAHPGVEIISRDRAKEYADGASRGAPTAIQVADRFHLLQNLREALQRFLEHHQALLRQATAPPQPVDLAPSSAAPSAAPASDDGAQVAPASSATPTTKAE